MQGLRAQGLNSIPGDIVIDNSAFSLPKEDPGAFDGRPNRSYNVVPDALMVNFQSIDFRLAANAETHRVDIIASPRPVNLEVDNHIRYAPGRCGGPAAEWIFKLPRRTGTGWFFPAPCPRTARRRAIARVLLQPTTYAFGTFVELWRQSGGEFEWQIAHRSRPRGRQTALYLRLVEFGRDRAAHQ